MTNNTTREPTRRRRALIVGGTSGLGCAVARSLVAAGSQVTITGRELSRAKAVAEEIGAECAQLDLTDEGSLRSFVAHVADLAPDQLVLNSGGPRPATASSINADDVRHALESLLHPHIEIVRSAVAGMTAHGWGRIVAIGSSGVQQPIPTLALSNIGRAALAAYLKSLAFDLAPQGVTVNMVLPGRIATRRVDELDASSAKASNRPTTEVREEMKRAIPAGRYGTPEEFAHAVTFLCSEGASYITGEQVRVDGGLVRHY